MLAGASEVERTYYIWFIPTPGPWGCFLRGTNAVYFVFHSSTCTYAFVSNVCTLAFAAYFVYVYPAVYVVYVYGYGFPAYRGGPMFFGENA